jgi:hypothetical protein
MANQDPWADARRIEAWAGEVRVNVIRLAALLAFYGHHLLNVYAFRDDPSLAGTYNEIVTALVVAWAAAVVVLHICLSRRWVPPALKYVSTGWDLMLVTVLLMVTKDPRTWLAILYFLVIATAPLRLSLPLIYFTTLGSIVGYGFFLWYVKYGLELPADQRLPRVAQVIVVLALGTAGILAGQSVRQARRLAVGYPVTVEESEGGEPGGGA